MAHSLWKQLENLIVVAGHAVYVADDFRDAAGDTSWCLQDFQKGEPAAYIEHIQAGINLAAEDHKALLIFSGGQTRFEAGPRSEAQSYWNLADHYAWWNTDVRTRSTTEEFARDSFENLLFAICRFFECTARFPRQLTIVTWAFKQERFQLHRSAIRFPENRFSFFGVNNPTNLDEAIRGEQINGIEPFKSDPYGNAEARGDAEPGRVYLGEKRKARNPFNRQPPYEMSCPPLAELLRYKGAQLYRGEVPWE
jgi:hypothetical protein